MNMQNPLENLKEGNQMLPVIVSVDEPKNAPDNALWFRPADSEYANFGPFAGTFLYLIYKRTGGNSQTDFGGFTAPGETPMLLTAMLSAQDEPTLEDYGRILKKTGWALVGLFDPANPISSKIS